MREWKKLRKREGKEEKEGGQKASLRSLMRRRSIDREWLLSWEKVILRMKGSFFLSDRITGLRNYGSIDPNLKI